MNDRRRQNEGHAENEGDDQATHKVILDLPNVAAAMRLRNKSGGAHSQEAEAEIDEIEDQAAQRDTADKAGIVKASHHRGVGGTDKREGDVGDDDRPGNRPEVAPACALPPAVVRAFLRTVVRGGLRGGRAHVRISCRSLHL